MREIKFRGYDIKNKKMFKVSGINFDDYEVYGKTWEEKEKEWHAKGRHHCTNCDPFDDD